MPLHSLRPLLLSPHRHHRIISSHHRHRIIRIISRHRRRRGKLRQNGRMINTPRRRSSKLIRKRCGPAMPCQG